MRDADLDADPMATGDFSEFETLDLAESGSASDPSDDFAEGAKWALLKVAAWLESTRFVAHDEVSQRAMDATKSLIAEHAKQAAADLRCDKTATSSPAGPQRTTQLRPRG